MIRKLIQLAIFLLIANAIYRIAPVSVHYYKFKDAVQELTLFSPAEREPGLPSLESPKAARLMQRA